jgi:hypothetical protein
MPRTTLHVDPAVPDLYHARFERHVPRVHVSSGTITVRYRLIPVLDWMVYAWSEPSAEITLNGSIPWSIEIHEGASKLTADLRGLQLRSFDIRGGASRVLVTLPQPSGTVPLTIGGGASNVAFHRPAGVAVRVQVDGGASHLVLDDQRFGAIGGGTRWESPDYRGAANRYDIHIGGGASHVTVNTR